MPASPSVSDSFTFVGGLNTEGGYFITPPNSWREGDNVVPDSDGSLSRRKALDYEEFYNLHSSTRNASYLSTDAFTVEAWESVAGNGNIEFFVVQTGTILHFYTAASGITSANKKSFTVNLASYQCFGNKSVMGSSVITTASCYGKLLVTSADTDPILITYNTTSGTIVVKRVELFMRDFKGIPTNTEPTVERTEAEWTSAGYWPDALYNLYNQGWQDRQVDLYKAAYSNYYPSNTKQWIYGKNADDDFDAEVLSKQDFGTSLAPKGRFILKAFHQDRATALASVPDTTTSTPTVPADENIYFNYESMGGDA